MNPATLPIPIRPPLRPTCILVKAASPPSLCEAVVTVLQKHFREPDIEAARVVYSAVAAHRLSGL
jgi:hypothetical protein